MDESPFERLRKARQNYKPNALRKDIPKVEDERQATYRNNPERFDFGNYQRRPEPAPKPKFETDEERYGPKSFDWPSE